MNSNIAHRQIARPSDQVVKDFPTLEQDVAEHHKLLNEVYLDLKKAEIHGQNGRFYLRSGTELLDLTGWSLSQLASIARIPTAIVFDNRLNPEDIGKILTQALHHEVYGQHRLLVHDEKTLLSTNSMYYNRIYDNSIVSEIRSNVYDKGFTEAPVSANGASGLYRSDRDMFLFLIDDKNRINVDEDGGLARGIVVWNSMTGYKTVGFQTFLYRYICSNHLILGSVEQSSFKRRHVGNVSREFHSALSDAIDSLLNDARFNTSIVTDAIAKEAASEDNAKALLLKVGLTKTQTERALELTTTSLGYSKNPLSYWALANGVSAIAHDYSNAENKLDFAQMAGALLEMAR